MGSLWQDIRYGIKLLVGNPGFTAVAVFSLAVGLGLNATVFCLVDRVILRPLPVAHPDELVLISFRTEKGVQRTSLPYPAFLELRNQSGSLSGIAGSFRKGGMIDAGETPELLSVEVVSRNYFSLLGVSARRGRVFYEGDKEAAEPVMVISHRLWQRRFGADPSIIGKTVDLNRKPMTVIGIAPAGFEGTERLLGGTDVWYPAETYDALYPGSLRSPRADEFHLLGRVPAGVSLDRVQAEMSTIARSLPQDNRTADNFQRAVVKFEARDAFDRFGILGLLLQTITGLILLIACVNVSNLLLARSQARRHEIAIRLALGAGRLRLTRQLLTESLVLSLVASVFGLLLTRWAIGALPALLPPMPMALFPDIAMSVRVYGFAVVLTFAATLIFALLPGIHASRLDLAPLLNESSGTGVSGRRYLGRNVLVVAQLCISLVLLTQAGLLAKSFVRGLQADVGFDKKNMIVAQFALGMYQYDESRARAFYRTLLEGVQALPGVRQVSLTRRVPLSLFGGGATQKFSVPGEADARAVKYNVVGLNYFQTMGTHILSGRDFTSQDIASKAKVVLVSQAFARHVWPGGNPLGKVLQLGDPPAEPFVVVGMVQDAAVIRIGEAPEPYLYLPLTGNYSGELTVLVETAGDPGPMANSFRQFVRSVDKTVAPLLMGTLNGTIRQGLYDRELMAAFMGAFGLLGLLLAAFGLYGIVSYTVGQRTREIGLRMALGAQRGDALLLILRQGLGLALLGTAIGSPLALAASYCLRSSLYQVSPADPTALAGTALLLIAVALLASYIPARRAIRIDPMSALRRQ